MSELAGTQSGITTRLVSGAPQRATLSSRYKAYMLLLMALIAMLAHIDRYILSILLVPIQQDLGASDTAMGLLGGLAFIAFYALAAVPVGRYADRGNRRNLLAVAVAVWSTATALCGAATQFVHLLLARIGVAAGESAANPASMSMIADMYPENRRATAIAFILVGTGVGITLGSFLAGVINDAFGWRTAFVIMGLPGVVLAAVIWLTFPEPVRGTYDSEATRGKVDEDSKTIGRTLRYLFTIPTFPALVVGKSLLQISFQAWLLWLPTFLIRVHEMTPSEMGLWFGLSSGGGAIVASLIGGPASDWLARNGKRWYLLFCAGAAAVGVPLSLAVLTVESTYVAVAMMLVYAILAGTVTAPSVAAGLAIVRPRMRAFMSVVSFICINLVGAGLGPLIIGAISDALKPVYGEEAIRYAMLIVPVAMVLCSIAFLWGSRTIERDARTAMMLDEEDAAEDGTLDQR
ncbi:MAG: spinster family MFS transporter [Pseudomonadota bacterium]